MAGKKKRPYNYDSYNRNNKNFRKDTLKNKNSKKKEIEYLENTNTIKIDESRLNDYESLDTSFLEGRIAKKVKKNGKFKKKILTNLNDNELLNKIIFIKKMCFRISLFFIFLSVCFAGVNCFKKLNLDLTIENPKKSVNEKSNNDIKHIIDDNYLFIGDNNLTRFEFEDYDLDYHFVKVAEDGLTTDDVLSNMKKYVYDYNPSIVFISVGLSDLSEELSTDQIISNVDKIVKNIKDNRPYARICIQSVYPINKNVDDYDDEIISDDLDNDDITILNSLLEEYCKNKSLTYIDTYSFLVENEKLSKKYTDNGIYLNKDGYKQVLKEINKIVG